MPKCRVIIYRTEKGRIPARDWLSKQNQTVRAKAIDLAKRLRDEGQDLDMPYARLLRDGIYELRIIVQRVQHRILYAFVGKAVVLLTHGITKESEVPPNEIDKALSLRKKYLSNPRLHTGEVYK